MAPTNVVVRAVPFQWTELPCTKFVPVRVRVKAAPPSMRDAGESEVRVGTGLSTTTGSVDDAPPPGAGFATETVSVPANAMSLAVMAAVTCVALTKVVVRGEPFHWTVAPFTKPVPLAVKVNAAPPARVDAGDTEVRAGGTLSMAKVAGFDSLPAVGLKTVTETLPATVRSLAGTTAVSSVALM